MEVGRAAAARAARIAKARSIGWSRGSIAAFDFREMRVLDTLLDLCAAPR